MKHLVFKRPFRWQETAKYLGLCTKVLETTKTNRIMNPAPCPSFHVDVFIIQLKLEMGQAEISREGCGIVKYPKMRN